MYTHIPVHRPETPAVSTHSSTRGLRLPEQLERQAEFPSSRVKPIVFLIVMYGCESWTIKKTELLNCGAGRITTRKFCLNKNKSTLNLLFLAHIENIITNYIKQ